MQVNVAQELFSHRRRADQRRTELAIDDARSMVDALIVAAPSCNDDDLEDQFCAQFGAIMTRSEDAAVQDSINPDNLALAVLAVLDEKLDVAQQPDSGRAVVQRLLSIVFGVLPTPLRDAAQNRMAHSDPVLQAARVPIVTGPAQWTCNTYRTRWAIVAPFSSAGAADRWYLWDVDTCGYEVVTVHSGYYLSAEEALAAWRQSVGPSAVDARPTSVDDRETLDALVPGELEEIQLGGEDQAQYAEFLRSRCLGGIVRQAVGRARSRTFVRLSASTATELFASRLRDLGHPDRPRLDTPDQGPTSASDLATEMADSWSPRKCPSLYPFCSPHKVAAIIPFLQDFYLDDFAAELIAVLPEWIRFLAEQTNMAAEEVEQCLVYAAGDLRFPGLLGEDGQISVMAQLSE